MLLTNMLCKLFMVGVLPSLPAMEDLLVPDVLPFGWFYLITLSFATALYRSLECLHSFIWFGNPVKKKDQPRFPESKETEDFSREDAEVQDMAAEVLGM